jgi:dihydrolipoamide dehydrogenase
MAEEANTDARTFDVIIIGGGPGGYSTALRAAELGKSVALVEEDERPGGTCLNEGCVPSKAMLSTARQMREAEQAERMGIDMQVRAVDLSRLLGFKNRVVATEVMGLEGLLGARKVAVFQAYAQVNADRSVTLRPSRKDREGRQGTLGVTPGTDEEDDPYDTPQLSTVVQEETVLHGTDIVLATGSRPRSLPGADFSEHAILDSRAALSLRQIPQSVIIIGSGAIGTEFATLWTGLGARVTLLEAAPRILPTSTRRISALETREMRRAGVTIQTGVNILSVKEGANQLATVRYEDSQPAGPSLRPAGAITPSDPSNPNNKPVGPAQDGDTSATAPAANADAARADGAAEPAAGAGHEVHELSAQFVLVAIGRVPNTDMRWLKDLGVKTDARGVVATDPYGRTSVDHVWAVGDITAGKQLAHKAYAQGLVVAESIAGVPTTPVDDHTVPAVTFGIAQVAQVGWDREEAQASGRFAEVQERAFPTAGNARVVMDGHQGVISVVSGYELDDQGNKSGERLVLGVQMIGPMVSELAGEAQELVGNKVPLHAAARLVHPHPTFSETLGEALLAADGRPLHAR